jgi:phage tail tube protein FII
MHVKKRATAAIAAVFLFAGFLAATTTTAGAQAASQSPVGVLDAVTTSEWGSGVEVRGWAADPSSPARDVKVDVYVDGDYAATTTTDVARPDVAAAFPAYGASTGFRTTVGLTGGAHRVCVFAIDADTRNTELGCESVTVPGARMPVGHLDAAAVSLDGSQVLVAGWAADPSSPARDVKVDVYVDGDYAATTTTDVARPDVAAAFPAYGASTGFRATVGLTGGTHRVCAFAIDADTLNTRLGCETVTGAGDRMPVGHLDAVTTSESGSGVEVRGWAADPSSPSRDVKVDVYVDGDYAATTTTDVARPDVAAAFPAYGASTGFRATVGLTGGTHRVCVFAIDADTLNTRLGCETVTGAGDRMPVGSLDVVTASGGGQVLVAGWAADPSSPSRDVKVDVYVDGDYTATTTTEEARPDVSDAFPAYGASTGFRASVAVAGGTHDVCVFAIDQDTLNTRLGCETVSVS